MDYFFRKGCGLRSYKDEKEIFFVFKFGGGGEIWK